METLKRQHMQSLQQAENAHGAQQEAMQFQHMVQMQALECQRTTQLQVIGAMRVRHAPMAMGQGGAPDGHAHGKHHRQQVLALRQWPLSGVAALHRQLRNGDKWIRLVTNHGRGCTLGTPAFSRFLTAAV